MSVRLTSSGLQGDYGRPVYTIYFNGDGTTGTNYPIGSVIEIQDSDQISLTGKWSGFILDRWLINTPTTVINIASVNPGRLALLQRTS